MLLVGDIGGTKSALALFSAATGAGTPLHEAELPSQQYPSLEGLVGEYLRSRSEPIEAACFGVAGPVTEGRIRPTNLPWTVDPARLRDILGIPSVRIVNDVQATAEAIPSLADDESVPIIEGTARNHGAIALIAPGTGLGQAFLVWDGQRYRSMPSEGGHVDFAPTDDQQQRLLSHLLRRYPHVSYERVCAGIGIPNVYDFLAADMGGEMQQPTAESRQAMTDRTRGIIDDAMSTTPSSLSQRTLELFVSILGAEAGNLALKVVATGGVYLAGGIPRRIIPALRSPRFAEAFRAKGRLSPLMSDIPVRVITTDAALRGAAIWGLRPLPGARADAGDNAEE